MKTKSVLILLVLVLFTSTLILSACDDCCCGNSSSSSGFNHGVSFIDDSRWETAMGEGVPNIGDADLTSWSDNRNANDEYTNRTVKLDGVKNEVYDKWVKSLEKDGWTNKDANDDPENRNDTFEKDGQTLTTKKNGHMLDIARDYGNK
jgi:hypothetical protein